jgi:hypothetical protein
MAVVSPYDTVIIPILRLHLCHMYPQLAILTMLRDLTTNINLRGPNGLEVRSSEKGTH